jgi:hypothetical protein
MNMTEDWRLQNQDSYLSGKEFELKKYTHSSENWDHDHCAFCSKKFSNSLTEKDIECEGYTTQENYYWVCKACFKDFSEQMKLYKMKNNN